ncbi:MAG: tRNA pseudouridine(13) synthase TruD [Planctomycetota bacterium]|jgi:tRNA pseudouridine13 synthase
MDALPFLTDTPGIGGQLKQQPEDFVVEEIPLYEPCGEGEFLYLRIRKRDVSATDLTAHIARTLGISQNDIGVAGRKDRRAVTTQVVSVPAKSVDDAECLNTDAIDVLDVQRHTNKLKTGHLKGNRFEITLRDTTPPAGQSLSDIVEATATAIARLGFLNYYGDQRFGRDNDTDDTGFRLLRGERVRRLSRNALRFALSAAQSRMFNDWVADRVRDEQSHTVMTGDVMQVVASGGCFTVDDAPTEQARFDERETVITGPIFGPKMRMPADKPAEHEAAILQRFDLQPEAFLQFRKLTSGTRRPLLIWPDEFSATVEDSSVRLTFTLPSGAYATSLLREFTKTESSTR